MAYEDLKGHLWSLRELCLKLGKGILVLGREQMIVYMNYGADFVEHNPDIVNQLLPKNKIMIVLLDDDMYKDIVKWNKEKAKELTDKVQAEHCKINSENQPEPEVKICDCCGKPTESYTDGT